ncbi:hypothetical protein COU38_01945 [Candidatus Micrarchaeota archaeon CG10_big_fil_rev_8_21_14_0_10_54_18]|nr:MAG: hypothetical protein COT57_02555 [Candidatus Micrarchaeota archaeon CG09_land_8_20_14_0_10_55_25]PJD01264.1 MAG: hypothetical protein COU38_01945 [Candidatus Micrarchaeota archaeon CG10_big_fil_rev_8_21_14_0_10_54_18]
MIVIGFDGATWDFIEPNLDELPNFKAVREKYNWGVLECDVRPIHSAVSWTTAFSGLTPEEHGLRDFLLDENEIKELKSRGIFVWDKVEDSVVMGVPASLPPLTKNYEDKNWVKNILSIKSGEMLESTKHNVQECKRILSTQKPRLLISIFMETDRAQHVFWLDKVQLLKHYKSCDRALGELLPFLEKDDFLVMSDHGFTDAEETKENKWDAVRPNQTGGHHPLGIAISNREPPKKISNVASFILKHVN